MAISGLNEMQRLFKSVQRMKPKGLAQGVGAEPAAQAGVAAPAFHQAACILLGDWFGWVFPAEHGGFCVEVRVPVKPVMQGADGFGVYNTDAVLAALLLLDGDLVPGFEAVDLPDGEPEQVADSKVGVDTKGKKRKVPRVGCQALLDGGDGVYVCDGFCGNGCPDRRMIAVLAWFHGLSMF